MSTLIISWIISTSSHSFQLTNQQIQLTFFKVYPGCCPLSARPPSSKPSSALSWMVPELPKWSPSFDSCSSQSLLNAGVGDLLLKCQSDHVSPQLKASLTPMGSACTTSKILHGTALHYLTDHISPNISLVSLDSVSVSLSFAGSSFRPFALAPSSIWIPTPAPRPINIHIAHFLTSATSFLRHSHYGESFSGHPLNSKFILHLSLCMLFSCLFVFLAAGHPIMCDFVMWLLVSIF